MFLIYIPKVVIFLKLANIFRHYFQHKILKNKYLTLLAFGLLDIKKTETGLTTNLGKSNENCMKTVSLYKKQLQM